MLRQQSPVELLRERRLQRELQEARLQQSLQRSAEAQAVQEGAALHAGRATARSGRFASAAMVWMSLTFVLCYLALPLGRLVLGLSTQTGPSVMATALAGAVGLLGVVALLGPVMAVARPVVQAQVDPDRILSATSGSLLVWGLLHNILPGLQYFSEMTGGELGSFVASNFLESALFGVMLASITRTGRGAFALGALFQVLLFGLSYLALGGLFVAFMF